MTWGDAPGPSTPSWGTETAAAASWTAEADPQPSGNVSRFIDADPLEDAEGGVDFSNTLTSENPAVVTITQPIRLTATRRNDP